MLDDGWFGNRFPRNDARAGLGDWQENRAKLPHGIDGLAEKAEELGIRFGIWVEPEMVNPQSELFLSHPDWVIGLPGRENRLERSQYLLDLSNPEVRGYILGVMRELLGKHPGIAYVKWDCNRKISDPGSAWLDARHQGNLAIDYVRGYESVLDALAEEFSQVVFQACSSGGGRADYGTMRRHHEFWTSDNTDACERVFMQWSFGHLSRHFLGSPRDGSPNLRRAAPVGEIRFDAAWAAVWASSFQPCDMTEEDAAFSRRALAEYKRIRPVSSSVTCIGCSPRRKAGGFPDVRAGGPRRRVCVAHGQVACGRSATPAAEGPEARDQVLAAGIKHGWQWLPDACS